MKNYRIYPSSINEVYIDEIVDALKRGEVIIYPTDTLYAIGCDALNNRAVEKVCRLKDINPAKQRLSIVCEGISQASEYAKIDNRAFKILHENLPGRFTFILPASPKLSKAFKGRKEVGVRVPDNDISRRIAEALGNPILSASVEWDGGEDEEVARPEDIALHYQGAVDIMIDGGAGSTVPSAVVSLLDASSPEILREGPDELI